MNIYDEAMDLHGKMRGKLDVVSKIPVTDTHTLSLVYSPGVAEPCRRIRDDNDQSFALTGKGNMVAVVSDGSAVLGLGNIGAQAALPVMEGKCVLFTALAGVNAVPLCLNTQDPDEIVHAVKLLEPNFAGINLEDIAAPTCFQIETELKRQTGMLIFHDDQHGTAVVAMAGLLNALKIVNKELAEVRVVISGAGAAGVAIADMLLASNVPDIVLCDSRGILSTARSDLHPTKQDLAKRTNPRQVTGDLGAACQGADVFIGVSVAGVLTPDMVCSMAKDPVVFALANPEPEILPAAASAVGARVVATGRSDFPNQVNNVLGFPGIFRGALDVRARDITDEMNMAAAQAIAQLVTPNELQADYVIPQPLDPRVAPAVAEAVAQAAINTGIARLPIPPGSVGQRTAALVSRRNEEHLTAE